MQKLEGLVRGIDRIRQVPAKQEGSDEERSSQTQTQAMANNAGDRLIQLNFKADAGSPLLNVGKETITYADARKSQAKEKEDEVAHGLAAN